MVIFMKKHMRRIALILLAILLVASMYACEPVYNIGANFYLLGSGARNLIVQNAAEPIDLDYNLEIVRCVDFEDCRTIKACARKALTRRLRCTAGGIARIPPHLS